MMDLRATIAFGFLLLAVAVALLLVMVPNRCDRIVRNYSDKEAKKEVVESANAIVSSVQILKSEKREGMRKVRVRLTVARKGETAREIVITDWVPIVLLGRLTVGSSVQLINDPVEDRIAFGL